MYQQIAIKKKGKREHRYEQKREGNARTIGTERTETGQLDVWLQPAWPKAVRDGRERARDGESRSRKGSSMRPNANKSFLTLLFWDPGPHLFRGELGGKRGGGTPPGLARLQPALPHARSFCALSRSHGPSGSELASSSEVSGVQCCSTFARKWPPSPLPASCRPPPAPVYFPASSQSSREVVPRSPAALAAAGRPQGSVQRGCLLRCAAWGLLLGYTLSDDEDASARLQDLGQVSVFVCMCVWAGELESG